MPAADVAIPAALSTNVCPNCGYSLIGLASSGVCPECGRTFDQKEIILYGWGRGRHESIINAKRSRFAWVLFLSIGWFLFQMPWILYDRRRFAIYGGIVVFVNAYLLIRRQSSAHPGLIQVRLNDQGCVQYDDLAGPSVIRDSIRSFAWIIPIIIAVGLVVSWRNRESDWPAFWVLLSLILVCEVLVWKACSAYRSALRQVREGSIADINAILRKPSSWRHMKDFSLTLVKPGNYRFRINSFDKFAGNDLVDAEVRVTEEQVAALGELVNGWISKGQQERDAVAGKLKSTGEWAIRVFGVHRTPGSEAGIRIETVLVMQSKKLGEWG